MNYEDILRESEGILSSKKAVKDKLQLLTELLNKADAKFTWVGFYFMNHPTQKLHLGPYTGAPTDHTIIDFGKGICGQVAVSGSTYVSDDVQSEDNYIACSIDVRAEIVLPIYNKEQLVAQLDIDSNTPNAFGKKEQGLLKEICTRIEKHCAEEMQYERYFGRD